MYTFGCNDDGALGHVMEADKDDGGLEDESGSLDGTLESASGSFEGGVDEEWNCGDKELESETTNYTSDLKSGLVQLNARIVQVSAGDSHSAALTADGRLYAWGTFRVSSYLLCSVQKIGSVCGFCFAFPRSIVLIVCSCIFQTALQK